MRIGTVILIITATIWLFIEGGLILRDKIKAKGTTKIDRMTRLLNSISVIIALCSPVFSLIIPAWQFSSQKISVVTGIGILVILSGFTLRYGSIHILGKYFRTTVEIEKDQKIIQKGPYKFIRHPSYSGIILIFIGYGFVSQNWLSLAISVILPAAALLYRISVEEAAFIRNIGAEYINYQSRTKKLIPGIY